MIKNILYICVLTVFLLPHIYYGCPTVCTCEDTAIGCVDNGLTEVPNGIPITTTYL